MSDMPKYLYNGLVEDAAGYDTLLGDDNAEYLLNKKTPVADNDNLFQDAIKWATTARETNGLVNSAQMLGSLGLTAAGLTLPTTQNKLAVLAKKTSPSVADVALNVGLSKAKTENNGNKYDWLTDGGLDAASNSGSVLVDLLAKNPSFLKYLAAKGMSKALVNGASEAVKFAMSKYFESPKERAEMLMALDGISDEDAEQILSFAREHEATNKYLDEEEKKNDIKYALGEGKK